VESYSFNHRRLSRAAVGALLGVVFSIVFAASTHLVPQGARQLITVNHQLRRVLSRAERESLKSILALLTPAGQNDAALALSVRVRTADEPRFYAIFSSPKLPDHLKASGIFLTPVLNL
jgi:hypothetical protein